MLDVVFSHVMGLHLNKSLSRDDLAFLVGKFRVHPDSNRCTFTMTDGNDKELAKQEIEFTDFPALEQDIWIEDGVGLLPSEH